MKLDQDLVREILLAIEASKNDPKEGIDLVLKNRSPRAIHTMCCCSQKRVSSRDAFPTHNTSLWQPTRLTYKGHEFLDTVRDEEIWRRTKTGAEKAGGAGLGLLLELGKTYGKQMLEDRLAIKLP